MGTGFGNGIAGYVRDQEHPWRVELTYIALLFQTGVLGITLYAFVTQRLAGVISAATKMAGLALLPFVFGMGGALLAAATNPYLNYGTGQWILFLPVAIFNAVLVRGVVGMAAGSKEFA
ncbi:MAG: hypothetical protein HKN64_04275 [Woeseiaceae bacterium]|nr:hypothetical protein [Woeseiaceae bacterium]